MTLQGIVNDTGRTPEVSLERLVPLVDYIGAWQCLPNISPWVLAYSRKGVQTAVRLPPPEVQWGGLEFSAPRAGSGDGTGSSLPAGEGGHIICSSLCSSLTGWGAVMDRSVAGLTFLMAHTLP